MYQECVDGQTPPAMARGDALEAGEYFRNLKKDHVSKRYENDDDACPAYGFKLTRKCWKDADAQRGNLSVNLVTCIHTAECSLTVQVSGEHFYHVATINLEALNRVLSSPFVAIYDPVDDPKNACHFELVPLDGTASTWQELAVLLDDPFPAGRLPSSDEQRVRAAEAYARYRQILQIRRWVRKTDGTLA